MTPPPPLHLGTTPWRGVAEDTVAEQSRDAEALGYQSFWLPESHFLERGAVPAPLLSLAAAAAVTERIVLGTVSLLLPIRDPVLVAEEVAVLDRLSGGRFILGLGRGFRPSLFRAFGVAVEDKRDRFERHLRIMVEAWNGGAIGPVRSDDDSEREAVRVAPRPLQQPHPPIWVAAFGPKAVAQASRLGLPYLASPMESLAQLEENYRLHAAGLAAAGPRSLPGSLPLGVRPLAVPVMRTVYVDDNSVRVAAVREGLEAEARVIAAARSGFLRRAAERPIDERAILGPVDEVRDRIEAVRRALGMTHLIVRSPTGLEPGAAERSLQALRAAFNG